MIWRHLFFSWINFSPSLSHSSCLRGESQRRGGFLSEGECAVGPPGLGSAAFFKLRSSRGSWSRCQVLLRSHAITHQNNTTRRRRRRAAAGLRSRNTADTTLCGPFLAYTMYHKTPDHLLGFQMRGGDSSNKGFASMVVESCLVLIDQVWNPLRWSFFVHVLFIFFKAYPTITFILFINNAVMPFSFG